MNQSNQTNQTKQSNHFQVYTISKKHWRWFGIFLLLLATAILLRMCANSSFLFEKQAIVVENKDPIDVAEQELIDEEQQRRNNAKRWYRQSCALCHGNEREGQLQNPALLDVKNQYGTNDVFNIIIDGKGDMPGGFLQGSEARAVADWLVE